MMVLTTSLDRRSEEFAANAAAMRALVEDVREKVAAIREDGGAGAWQRHLARGKLLPRERVRALLDPGSPFLELSQLAAYGVCDGIAGSADTLSCVRAHRGLNRASMMAQVAMALAAVVNGPHSA
jgi:3-methylcrotonyl-CoA carboxylase beta subunit